jgi:hypothetical protein
VQFRLMGQNEETVDLEYCVEFFANDLPDIEPAFDEATSLRVEVYPYEKKYVDNPAPDNDRELQRTDPHVLKTEINTARFKQHFIMVLVVEYRRTQLLRAAGFQRKVPAAMLEAKARYSPSSRPLVDVFMEKYHITDDPDDFVPDSDINYAVGTSIKMTDLHDAIAEYAKKHGLTNLKKKQKMHGSSVRKNTRGVVGIITIEEYYETHPDEDEDDDDAYDPEFTSPFKRMRV